jgi:heme oxygenase
MTTVSHGGLGLADSSAASPTIMERLRDSTAEAHKKAEGHPLQRALATGALSKELYVAFHSQLYLVHGALEALLAAHAAKEPAISKVVKLYQLTAQYHAADLRFFGVDLAAIRATKGTTAIIGRIGQVAKENAAALLGYQYVLEGSKNGSKFLSRVVMKAYGLAPGMGVLAMDPYGDHQRAYWQQFKDDMNSIGFAESQAAAMIAAAAEMFEAIASIGDDVMGG